MFSPRIVGLFGVFALAACGVSAPLEPQNHEPTKGLHASLMYDGSAHVTGTTSAGAASLEISATILPNTFKGDDGLYAHEGDAYPKSYEEAVEVARNAAMPYAELLVQCAALHPEIVLAASGQTLTELQLQANLEAVFECSYSDFGIKPYWIPQLIDDVDVCSVVLGGDWHLPTEAELASFSDPARQVAADALRSELYGNVEVFARASDGTLRIGSIAPGVRTLHDITYPSWYWPEPSKKHNEASTALRCLRAGSSIP
ncbi:MAG TPA: hypothetical protein VGK67_01895 [Myxococcales bacterium]